MNKFTREHYPAAKVPKDLREGVDPRSTVTVTVTVETEADTATRMRLLVDLLAEARRAPPIGDDSVARIRELRDEWDA